MPEALDLLRRLNEAQRIGQTESADMMRAYLEDYDHAHGYESDLSPRPLEAKGKHSARPLPMTREQQRSGRHHEQRARTFSVKRHSKHDREMLRVIYPEATERDYWHPTTRADCADPYRCPRPCPFVSCKWNLYLDVMPRTGAIKLNFPDLEPHEMGVSCALDVALAKLIDARHQLEAPERERSSTRTPVEAEPDWALPSDELESVFGYEQSEDPTE